MTRVAASDDGKNIHRTMIALQQALMDHAYANENVARFTSLFTGKKFGTADYYPGKVPADASTVVHNALINASNAKFIGRPHTNVTGSARRPTGAYAPAGNIVEVTVPNSMVNSGFSVRVGAHSWDLKAKATYTRLDRISLTYPINCNTMQITSPLGGGIYIEVPYEADAGIEAITLENVVRSPFYSARSFTEQTSAGEWETEKSYQAPWTDFESDLFMMQEPTAWLDRVENPAVLMNDWDTALQEILNLYGITELNKTALYTQVDTILRGVANFPGYPMSNFPYNPTTPTANTGAQWMLKGPQLTDWITLHEYGHSLLFSKFPGEVESVVNLPFVRYMNAVLGIDLDIAFGKSIAGQAITLDDAIVNWMVRPNFKAGNGMQVGGGVIDEYKYQHRGFGKYVAIAKLFGWVVLDDFWKSVNNDYLNGIDYSRNNTEPGEVDSRILRMSRAANTDLTPLIHAWGTSPVDPSALSANLRNENIEKSPIIYDELQRYKSLIPMTNAAFLDHASIMYPTGLSAGNTDLNHVGWYFVTADTYSVDDGNLSLQALQDIIDLYFPSGRPSNYSLACSGLAFDKAHLLKSPRLINFEHHGAARLKRHAWPATSENINGLLNETLTNQPIKSAGTDSAGKVRQVLSLRLMKRLQTINDQMRAVHQHAPAHSVSATLSWLLAKHRTGH